MRHCVGQGPAVHLIGVEIFRLHTSGGGGLLSGQTERPKADSQERNAVRGGL